MVLMTVLAFHAGKGGIEAEVHPTAEGDMVVRPSDEEAPVSDRYDGPPNGSGRTSIGPGRVIVRMTSRRRRAFSRRRPCYRRTRHPVRQCSRWCGYRRSHG